MRYNNIRKGGDRQRQGSERRKMEGMTDLQFKTFIKSILEIIKSSKDLKEAEERIKALLD